MPQKVLQVMAAVAFVAAVGTAAFFVAGRFAGGQASGQPASESSDFFDELADRLQPTIDADHALPRARGQYGDFVLVGMDASDPRPERPCSPSSDGPIDDLERARQSELYSPAFGDAPEAYECTDGTIYGMAGRIQREQSLTEFGNGYFVGEALVRTKAPRERLELTTVAGRPAVVDRGLDLSPFPVQTRLTVLQRAPSALEPGIMLTVHTPLGVDEAIKLAEGMMR